MSITPEDIKRVKGEGFLLNRGTQCFSGRIITENGTLTTGQLICLGEAAREYGSGTVAFTTRMTVEVPGIPYESIPAFQSYIAREGMVTGGTGARVRPVTSCKGTTCVFGMYDTQAVAREIHEKYYLGWDQVALPHKFKIAVGGCPNSCVKPSLNDFGIEGRRTPEGVRFQVYLGGTWGRTTRMGTPYPRLVEEGELFPLLEKTMLWFRENAWQRERLGAAMDRLGAESLLSQLEGDGLLERKEAILSAELQQRPKN